MKIETDFYQTNAFRFRGTNFFNFFIVWSVFYNDSTVSDFNNSVICPPEGLKCASPLRNPDPVEGLRRQTFIGIILM